MFEAFGAWKTKYANVLIDMGGRLDPGKLITHEGPVDAAAVSNRERLGGYMIVEATSFEAASEVAQACPGLVNPNSSVWVREIHRPG